MISKQLNPRCHTRESTIGQVNTQVYCMKDAGKVKEIIIILINWWMCYDDNTGNATVLKSIDVPGQRTRR